MCWFFIVTTLSSYTVFHKIWTPLQALQISVDFHENYITVSYKIVYTRYNSHSHIFVSILILILRKVQIYVTNCSTIPTIN